MYTITVQSTCTQLVPAAKLPTVKCIYLASLFSHIPISFFIYFKPYTLLLISYLKTRLNWTSNNCHFPFCIVCFLFHFILLNYKQVQPSLSHFPFLSISSLILLIGLFQIRLICLQKNFYVILFRLSHFHFNLYLDSWSNLVYLIFNFKRTTYIKQTTMIRM